MCVLRFAGNGAGWIGFVFSALERADPNGAERVWSDGCIRTGREEL